MSSTTQLGIQMLSMTSTQVRALTTTDISSLTVSDIEALPALLFGSFTTAQIAAINTSVLSGLDATTFSELSKGKLATFTTTMIGSLTSTEIGTLTITKLGALSPAQIAAISPDAFSSLSAARVASLSSSQIAALTSGEVQTLTGRKLSFLSSDQIAAIQSSEIASLGVTRLIGLSSTQASALTTADISALTTTELSSLMQHGLLTTSQLGELTSTTYAGIAPVALRNLDLGALDYDQISGLTSGQVAKISAQSFGTIGTLDIAAISTGAIQGITTTQMDSLSTSQLESFSTPQMAAMTGDQLSVIKNANPFIEESGLAAGTSTYLSYSDALSILQSAASEPLSENTIDQLQAFAEKFATPDQGTLNGYNDLMVASNAVTEAIQGVIFGDPENNIWYGGGNQPQAASNLSSTSTPAEFQSLINQWFLGSNLPSLQTDSAGDIASATYEQTNLPLFGASGDPKMTDVVEGGLSDSALLAGIAETALQDPSYLANLFTDNGNGTYSVAQPAMFGSTYVTVNGELPVTASGESAFAAANSSTGSWVAMLEKAAAQGAVDSGVALSGQSTTLGNTYAALTLPVNADDMLSLYTGEQMSEWDTSGGYSQSSVSANLSAASQNLNSGRDVVLQVDNNYFAVTSINSNTGAVGIYDPSTGHQSSITISPSTPGDTVALWYASAGGRAAA